MNKIVATSEPQFLTEDDSPRLDFEVVYNKPVYQNSRVTGAVLLTYAKNTGAFGTDTASGSVEDVEFYTETAPLNWSVVDCKLGKQFGDLKVSDFMVGLFQKFNFVIHNQTYDSTKYEITQYYDWIIQGNRLDWSNKVSQR